MANEERKAQLSFGVDASGVKQGMAEIKRDVREMAQDVQQSGQQAAKGIQAIGDGAPAAAQKMDGATKSIVGSIERATAAMQAGEKGSASYFEALAKQRGANADVLRPYLEQLRQAEEAQRVASGSLNKMGVSAAQTAAALRGVPAQFTDIIVSLQGGQAPLTVFLQQGGQLKDMFGGAGNAARALGGYVLGLVNPLNVAAAAAGVLAFAYHEGSKEAQAYSNALILTGNAAGTTSGQLKAYAQDISGVVGTQGKAAESLTALAGTGKVVGDVLRDAGLAAVQYERATGQAVSKTADQFADLRNEPLAGVLKLNDGMNFLTESTYRQIKSLEEQGRTTDAARVAQEAYATALSSRSTEIERNLGSIERAWLAIKDAAKGGWDAILNLGRPTTNADQLERARTELESRMQRGPLNEQVRGNWEKGNEQLRQQIALLGEQERMLKRGAAAEAERVANRQAYYDWEKQGDAFQSKAAKRQAEVNKAEVEGAALVAAGLITKADLLERISDINEKYKEKSASAGQSEVATIRAKIKEEQAYIARLRDSGAEASKLTEGERLVAKLQEELTGKLDARTRASKQLALAEAQRLATVQAQRVEEERSVKNQEQAEASYRKFLDSIYKGADATRKQAEAQEAANESFGKSKTAIAEMNLEQSKLARDMAKDAGPWTPEYLAAMDAAIDAQERWVRALQAGDLKTINAHTDELLRAAKEQAQLYADEGKLTGLTRLEREKIVALRQVELKYAKELEKIEKSGLSEDDKADQRAKVEQAKRIEGEAAVSKVIQQDWDRTADEINKSLTDALLRGFESGKGFAKNFRDTLINMFNTLVLRPIISYILAPVSGAISGITNGIMGGGAGGGALDILSVGKSIYSAISGGFTSLTNSIAMYVQRGFNYLTGAGPMTAGQLPGAAAQGVGLAGSYVAGAYGGVMAGRLISNGYSVFGSSGNTAVNAGTIIGSIFGGPMGGVIGGAIGGLVNRVFGRKLKDTGIEGEFGGADGFQGRTYQYYKGGFLRSDKTKYGTLDEEVRKGLADQYTAMRDSIKEMGKVLGLGGEALDKFTARIKVSLQGLSPEDAEKRLKEEFEKLGISMADLILGLPTTIQEAASDRKYLFGVNPDAAAAPPVDPAAQANLEAFKKLQKAGESSLDTLTRLATSLAATNGVFETLGHSMYAASLQGGDMADKLVELFGGVEKFTAASADYFAKFYSAEEQREAARKQLEKQLATVDIKLPSIDATDARAQYRKLVEAQDLNTEAGRKAYAMLIQLAGAFDAVAVASQDAAAAAAEAARQQQEITSRGRDLEQRLLIAQGKDRQALDLRRLQEYYALLNLNPELAKMVIEIYKAEDAAEAVVRAQQGREDAYRKLQNAATLQSERLNAQLQTIDAQRTALGQQRTLADESLALLTGIFDLVRTNARELYGQVESTASMQAAAGWAFVERALATAKATGYLPEQAPLQEAIGAARSGLDERAYVTQFERDRDRLVLAGMLSGIEEIAGPQKTAVERQIEAIEAQGKALDAQTETINGQLKAQQEMLEFWRRQIDIANGTFDATLSVEQAIEKLRAALTAGTGSGAGTSTGSGKEVGSTRPEKYQGEAGKPTAVWGGSSATSGSSGVAAAEAKYKRVVSLGTAGAGYEPVVDQARIAKLDGLYGLYHSFDGTGDLLGLLTAIRGAGGTLDDLSILSGYYYSDWVKAAASVNVPAFAVGTNYVPRDMLAQIHEGEAIVPKAFNPWANGGGTSAGADNAALVAEVRALRAEVAALRAAGERTADNTTRLPAMAEQFEDVTAGGNAMRMEMMN